MGIDLKDLADLLDGKTIEVTPEDAAKLERAIKANERAKMAERVHDIMSSSILTPAESLKSGADSLVDGIMLANADPNNPDSSKKGIKMVMCVFGIIITIVVQALAAYIVAFNYEFVEVHHDVIKVIFGIIEIGGLLFIIRLIRAIFDRPLLIKMLFDREAFTEANKYHGAGIKGTKSILFVVLLVLIAIITVALVLLLV
ncbi:MAG: hypothetical protein E7304_12845 [Butyrivibrio sp.]|uniref:hypothetical protein n=1 Tax=Butyrivibrio sp. TaxID=28121 RepID=UPI001ED0733C|nr:hypothetical protein [Butyrivibrio sp.]MBE5842276.1 hypothetical protein [Butyrivibrio sp.]